MKKWTDADEKQLTELRAQGKQYKEIAAIMGRTEKSVKAYAAYIIHRRPLKPRLHLWTEAQDETLMQMRVHGHTFVDIAKKVGKNVTTVQNRYYSILAMDAGSDNWPPTKDPWPVKTNFAEHNLKLKPARTVVKNTDHSGVRSLIGNSSAMCAK